MPELSFARRRASRPHAALVDRAAPALQLSSHLAFRPYRELFGDLPHWRRSDRIRHRRYSGRVQLVDQDRVEVLLSEWPSGRTLRVDLSTHAFGDVEAYAGQPVRLDTWITVNDVGDPEERLELEEHRPEADSP